MTVSLLPLGTPPSSTLKLSYLQDTNHFLFALFLIPGAVMLPLILRGINSTANKLLEDDIIDAPLSLHQTYTKYQKYANHWLGKLISVFLASTCLSVFLNFVLHPDYSSWWGSSAYGSAGFMLALIEFGMVYFGTQAIFHVGFGAAAIGNIARRNIHPRLFHPDGCGGLSPFGELIIYIWIFSISLAAEILITIKLGYLGIEYWPSTWIIAFIGICVLPFAGLYPLYHCVYSLHIAKSHELNGLESPILSFYTKAKISASNRQYIDAAAASDRAGKLITLYNHLVELNIWPFNRRAFYVIGAVYFIQLCMTMRELFSKH